MLGGRLKATEKHSLQKATVRALLVLRGLVLTLLEDCSGWIEPQKEVKTQPADAAKEGRPYHTGEADCNRSGGGYLLDIFYFVTTAGAASQNGKADEGYYREEYYDNQNLDCREQKAAEREDGTKQGDHQQNQCGDTANCFKKKCHNSTVPCLVMQTVSLPIFASSVAVVVNEEPQTNSLLYTFKNSA
jgi:hypothetical protein